MLIFTPFLIFLPVGFLKRLRTGRSRRLAILLGIAVAAQILLYAKGDWRGGVAWGPRWLTDILPILMWMLAPAFYTLRARARHLLIAAMAASVGIQAIGAFCYMGGDARIFAEPQSMRAAWNPRNTAFLMALRQSFARPDLHCAASGAISRIGSSTLSASGALPVLTPGSIIKGSARGCGRSPAQLDVLIDGIVIGTTKSFAGGTQGQWQIAANISGVRPGERVLQLAVRVQPTSMNFRIVRERRVLVAMPPLSPTSMTALQPDVSDAALHDLSIRAAAALRGRQSVQGYWLTTFTPGLLYDAPQDEMNTYLTSIMVDVLQPIAGRSDADVSMLDRARRHLLAQIEPNGLARYHGLPNAPTIGTLGCAITPDADDTALIWRIAGNGARDPRRKPMLAKLAQYRDARGLYRTWLAPQKDYQCLALGRDPDPTDMGIQLHVYLMLHAYDLPAARALCQAMLRAGNDGDVWVYYAKTALIPYLRSAEVRRLGCPVPLPADRLSLPAAGQEVWSDAVRLLVGSEGASSGTDERRAIRHLLARLGDKDFAALRRTPPLIYHNDMSSNAKRVYWSVDLGYALWLRLYDALGVDPKNQAPQQ